MLFGNFCSVAITGWFAVPWVSRLYQNWLEGKGTKKRAIISINNHFSCSFYTVANFPTYSN